MKSLFLFSILLISLSACDTNKTKPGDSQTQGYIIDTLPADTMVHPMRGRNGCVPKGDFNLKADSTFQIVDVPEMSKKGIKLEGIWMHEDHHPRFYPRALFITTQDVVDEWNRLVSSNGCNPDAEFAIGICDETLKRINVEGTDYHFCSIAGLMCGGVQLHPDIGTGGTDCTPIE